jgi:hypothetical protein
MRLYHATTPENAAAILIYGFKNGEDFSMGIKGVFLSSYPFNVNDGAERFRTVLNVKIPVNLIADYEVIEDGKPYREWCVPAEIVNRYPVSID